MTAETIAVIIVAAIFCCFLVYRWQEAMVDMADPPYQKPVEDAADNVVKTTQLNPKAAWPFPSGEKP